MKLLMQFMPVRRKIRLSHGERKSHKNLAYNQRTNIIVRKLRISHEKLPKTKYYTISLPERRKGVNKTPMEGEQFAWDRRSKEGDIVAVRHPIGPSQRVTLILLSLCTTTVITTNTVKTRYTKAVTPIATMMEY